MGFFNTFLYKPLFNLLILLYHFIPGHDFGIAVIILTVVIRLILYPLSFQSVKTQKALSELQPKIREIQEKHKHDKEKQSRALMELYQEEKVNPLGGCLPTLLQLPILVALYRVFWRGFQASQLGMLYSFVPNPGHINTVSLGIIDLSQSCLAQAGHQLVLLWPNIVLVLLAGFLQYLQTKMVTPKPEKEKTKPDSLDKFSGLFQKQMLYFFPILLILILWKLPSAVTLYIVVTSLFSIFQQRLVLKAKLAT